ncbi:MAG: class C sortase [Clostridiales Family XIII bacterium]|jgi:sortase A|nr:class C sortase [Clostridiales Family XIII bacterium]
MKSRILTIVIVGVLLLAGIGILGYPWFSNWYATRGDARIIRDYDRVADGLSEAEKQAEFDKAARYNLRLDGTAPVDPFSGDTAFPFDDYKDILDANGNGVMAYLQIPKIGARLPVYHGVTPEVLEHGVGHIPTTALPVGGEGTFCVLAGHRGLPGYELFTNLDALEIGDTFSITVLDRLLTYTVDDISVVLPDETDIFTPVPGKDYVTLATCTPLGINSHRLLVRGVRSANPEVGAVEAPGSSGLSAWQKQTLIAGSITAGVMLGVIFLIVGVRRRRKEESGD